MAKVLVVDDEQSVRDLARMILVDSGHEVITAQDGAKAIQEFQQEKPDLVLLDILMPGLNGVDVCRILRSQISTSKHVPIVMFTVLDDEEDRRKAEEARCDGYFLKPFTPEDLPREVDRYLRKVRGHRSPRRKRSSKGKAG